MPLWKAPSVAKEPVTVLSPWIVYEVPGGNRHLVGYTGYEGRVSSRIRSFNPSTRTVITNSGRHYKLLGPAGHSSDAEYVWATFKYINGFLNGNVKEVSEEYEEKSNRPSSSDVAQ